MSFFSSNIKGKDLINYSRLLSSSIVLLFYLPSSFACGPTNDGKNTCIIFITHATYDGHFNNTTCDHGGCHGYKGGADAICKDEAAKYHSDLVNQGITFKALLDHANATRIHQKYYREDGVTFIAEASGNYLREHLDNAIIDSPQSFYIWTGIARGTVSGKSNQQDNCSAWTNDCNIAACGGSGRAGLANRNGDNNQNWDDVVSKSCFSDKLYLACVAQ